MVGAGSGGDAQVVVSNPDGSERGRVDAFPGFRGGVRVAAGDVTGDGSRTSSPPPGRGGGPHVKVFDGVTGAEIRSFFAYDPALHRRGVRGGRGRERRRVADIVTGAGAGRRAARAGVRRPAPAWNCAASSPTTPSFPAGCGVAAAT